MKPRILVVDDDAMLRETLASALANRGWDVETAKDGEEGLAKWTSDERYDVLSTDHDMPNANGMTLLLTAKRGKGQSFVMCSGNDDHEADVRAMGGTFFNKTNVVAYVSYLDGIKEALVDRCACGDCLDNEDGPCHHDCSISEECEGCRFARLDAEEDEFEYKRMRGLL